MAERFFNGQKEKSVIKSRLFKAGAVATLVGIGFGIGVVVEAGALAAAGGAGWTYAFGNPQKK